MNLVRIEHAKCNEYNKTDYYVVPEGKTAEEVEADVEAAQAAYFKARDAFAAAYPQPEGGKMYWANGWKSYPDDITVGEAKRREAEAVAAKSAWETMRSDVAGSFQSHLAALGYLTLWDADQMFKAEADWGHRHGEDLRF